MRIDFSAILLDMKGVQLVWRNRDGTVVLNSEGKPTLMTLSSVCSEALLGTYDDDRATSGDAKFKRFRLAMKISDSAEVDLKAEEVTEIKSFLAKAFGPLVIGRAYDLLDPEGEVSLKPVKARPTAVG